MSGYSEMDIEIPSAEDNWATSVHIVRKWADYPAEAVEEARNTLFDCVSRIVEQYWTDGVHAPYEDGELYDWLVEGDYDAGSTSTASAKEWLEILEEAYEDYRESLRGREY